MIGMANKANKIVSGEENLRQNIRQGKVKLIIIASDASENTKKRFSNSAKYYNIGYFIYLTKLDFKLCLAGKTRAVIGILDENFSNSIERLICNVLKL